MNNTFQRIQSTWTLRQAQCKHISIQYKLKKKLMENTEKWYVYLLLCDEKTYYVGITNNLLLRTRNHREKNSLFTLRFNKIKLVYCESYDSKYQAAKREKQLKGWSRAKKQKLIDRTLGINTCTKIVEEILGDENLI